MKITDVSLTLFAWDSIPATTYGHHSARPTGKSDLGLLRVATDAGVEGHAFLGTSSNPASLDGPALIRFLKPVVMGQNPLDRERLNRLLWARARTASVRGIGAVDIALWDIAGKIVDRPIHHLLGGSKKTRVPTYASLLRYGTSDLVARNAAAAVARGYTHVKLHEHAVEIVAAARNAVSPGADSRRRLVLGWNSRLSRAPAVSRSLGDLYRWAVRIAARS